MVDVVTHAAIGCVLAAPVLAGAPEAALALAFGSVLPDLDACSRLFGKRAFLACHQTWSHALPVIALVAIAAVPLGRCVGLDGWQLGLGLGAGMLLHSLLDLANTYGIALWRPFSARRHCLEWMFFIDLGTMAITATALAWIGARIASGDLPGWWPTIAWTLAMTAWLALRCQLRRRAAGRAPPGLVTLLPSAWSPLRFFATVAEPDAARLLIIDGWRPQVVDDRRVPIHDQEAAGLVGVVPEVEVMRGLSPAYHAVDVQRSAIGVVVEWRDLRTRNFATRFGACRVAIAPGVAPRIDFDV